jgi:hypothetical protein
MTKPHALRPSIIAIRNSLVFRFNHFLVCCYLVALLLTLRPDGTAAGAVVSNLGNTADGTSEVHDLAAPRPGSPTNRSNSSIANSFTTGSTMLTLESVTLFMANANASLDNGGFGLGLYSDLGGQPDVFPLFVSFTGSSHPATSGNYTYTASAFSLDPNTTYWLVARVSSGPPDTAYEWGATSDLSQASNSGWSIGTTAIQNLDVGFGWIPDTSTAQLFSVQVVPEPSAALLVIGSGAGLLVWRKRS